MCKHYKVNRNASRTYWSNYIDSIIDSIKEDKDTIIDMLMYGNVEKAKITIIAIGKMIAKAMKMAKKLGKKPRETAEIIIKNIDKYLEKHI